MCVYDDKISVRLSTTFHLARCISLCGGNHPLSIHYSHDCVWSHRCNQNKLVKSASILLAQSEMENECVCVCIAQNHWSLTVLIYSSRLTPKCSCARQSQTSVQGTIDYLSNVFRGVLGKKKHFIVPFITSSVLLFGHYVVSNFLRPHGLQRPRLPS